VLTDDSVETDTGRRGTIGSVPVINLRLCGPAQPRSAVEQGGTPPCESILPAEAVEAAGMTYPLRENDPGYGGGRAGRPTAQVIQRC
jgi:hypothetical protein